MDIAEDIRVSVEGGDSDIDSDNDENICRTPTKSSPHKSPLKLSSALKRKRRLSLSEAGPSQESLETGDQEAEPGKLVSYSDDSEKEEDLEEDEGDIEDEDEECMLEQSRAVVSSKKTEFVFKEPSFRKKQFIFHPFKSVSGVLTPDTESRDNQVTVTIPEQLGEQRHNIITMK